MAYDNNEKRMESVYSKRIRAGKRRTYFFDVKATRGNDYYLTITESRKRFNDDGYDRHKIFLYKEDFNKFIKALGEAVDYVKTDLMPDFDFDAFNHEYPEGSSQPEYNGTQTESADSRDAVEVNGTSIEFQGNASSEINGSTQTEETSEPEKLNENPSQQPDNDFTPPASFDNSQEVDKW